MSVYDTMVAGLSSAGLVLLGFVTTQGTSEYHLNAGQLQASLQHNAEQALRDGGFDWATVNMDGQRAILGGYPPNAQAGDAASQAVLTSSGQGGYLWGGVWLVETDFDDHAPVSTPPQAAEPDIAPAEALEAEEDPDAAPALDTDAPALDNPTPDGQGN